MTYQILHRLFGWDYIQWRNSVAQGIARVHTDHNGRVFYWRYKLTRVADHIREPNDVLWLTCRPEKYLGRKEEG